MKKIIITAILITAFFSSCSTMKDILISDQRTQSDANLAQVEALIIPLEAAGGAEARRRQNDLTSARQRISAFEREASADAEYSAKLIAWSGRLALLEGRYSEAQRLYRQSTARSAGNIPSIVLGIRLEGDPNKKLEMIERELALTGQQSTGVGELNIERGNSLLQLNRFTEAAGAFDVAFAAGLPSVYNENYGALRNRAWDLRNTTGVSAGTLNMLIQETISWNDCITIVKNETQLLRFITGGRNISDADMFSRLVERGFIPSDQDVNAGDWTSARARANDTVTRAGAAFFVWHLFAEARGDRSLLTRYSARYATGSNPRSPIADIPPLSPFFDSILGCVEREFISLPDGRNFRPALPIRGPELLAIIRRIDN
jgi:tetratricopeptide (TPR) repeat protein